MFSSSVSLSNNTSAGSGASNLNVVPLSSLSYSITGYASMSSHESENVVQTNFMAEIGVHYWILLELKSGAITLLVSQLSTQ
uniref:Uncharacterized protein n=1 Tax=Glossina pallidipes TaxID=7398 RepID=A0A1B0A8B8_GLOPL